jgi:hypothetical protein
MGHFRRDSGAVRAGRSVAYAGVIGLTVAACATDAGSARPGSNNPPVTNGSVDGSVYVFPAEAGPDAAPSPLLAPCTPGSATACTTGFECFSQHTSPNWWVDLYGTCTFECNDQTLALCESFDGVCGCPVDANGNAEACTGDGGVAMVCVPAVKPGTAPGAHEGDGGCGSAGCGGGAPVEAGAPSLPADASAD